MHHYIHIYLKYILIGFPFQSKELVQELEECRLQISHTLQSNLQSDGRRRYATPPQQISAFNRRSTPEILDNTVKPYYNPTDLNVVIGDDVIKLNPNGDFNLHFPIRRGDFNLHGGVGGSVVSIYEDHFSYIPILIFIFAIDGCYRRFTNDLGIRPNNIPQNST